MKAKRSIGDIQELLYELEKILRDFYGDRLVNIVLYDPLPGMKPL